MKCKSLNISEHCRYKHVHGCNYRWFIGVWGIHSQTAADTQKPWIKKSASEHILKPTKVMQLWSYSLWKLFWYCEQPPWVSQGLPRPLGCSRMSPLRSSIGLKALKHHFQVLMQNQKKLSVVLEGLLRPVMASIGIQQFTFIGFSLGQICLHVGPGDTCWARFMDTEGFWCLWPHSLVSWHHQCTHSAVFPNGKAVGAKA